MGTEDYRIEDGHFKVDRVETKPSLNVDLASVEEVYFERSVDPAGDGALVLTTRDGESHLIRVSNEDDDTVLGELYDNWRSARKEAVAGTEDLLSTMDEQSADKPAE